MPPQPPTLLPPHKGPRLIVYAQTFHDHDGKYHSLLPLLTNNTGITHVIVAAIHLNDGPGNITLNDHPPDDARFTTLWGEVKWLQGSGVKVLGMLGGAAKGSYERLTGSEEQFEAYYHPLKTLIKTHNLNGLDLDIEEPVPLQTPTRLITRLRSDFGPDFLITMAPVATALLPDPNQSQPTPQPHPMLATEQQQQRTPNPQRPTLPHLSGFSYPDLESSTAGAEIAWYNTQFYCGWGDARTSTWYDAIIAAGWKPEKVVLGVVTNPANGAGHVALDTLRHVCAVLREKCKGVGMGFGGVMGWEYFNAGGCESDVGLVASLGFDNETLQAGWVAALGRVLRSVDPPRPPGAPPLDVTPDLIRQMVGAALPVAPAAAAPWPEDKVSGLVAVGFSRREAIAALNAADGDVDMAAGLLFDQ